MHQIDPDIFNSKDIRVVVRNLEGWLREPLPGRESQLRMSSNLRLRELMRYQTPADAVPSSVLILLYPAADGIRTVFIRRPRYDGVHSGQISLPGGKAEPGDPDTGYTALRETEEEIGVPAAATTLIGRLTDLYIPPSNFLVTPWIGYVPFVPVFSPDPSEVDGVIEILIRDLADDGNIREVSIHVHGMDLSAPAFVLNGEVIWGATAMILSEFREVIGKRTR